MIGVENAIAERIAEAAARAEKMRKLEAGLAFEHCLSVLEGNTFMPDVDRYDLGHVNDDAVDQVAECVEYLEWRGLLSRDTENRNIVGVLNECEATR